MDKTAVNIVGLAASNRSIASVLLTVLYLLGIKIATGFWAVLFAIISPYGLYLSVEAIAKFIGIIA